MSTEIKNYTNETTWLWETYLLAEKTENSLTNYNNQILWFLEQQVFEQDKSIKLLTAEELKKLSLITWNNDLKHDIEKSLSKEKDLINKAIQNWDIKKDKSWKYIIEISDNNYYLYGEILNTFLEQYVWTDYIWRELKWKENWPIGHVFTLDKGENGVFHVASMEMKY